MFSLTPKQAETLRFIQGYIERHGQGPCLSEICRAIDIRYRSGAHRLVTALEERGAIKRIPGHKRGIEVLHPLPLPRTPDGVPLRIVSAAEMARGAQ